VFWCKARRRTDADNLVKLATDALNGIAYTDDYFIGGAMDSTCTQPLLARNHVAKCWWSTFDEEAALAA